MDNAWHPLKELKDLESLQVSEFENSGEPRSTQFVEDKPLYFIKKGAIIWFVEGLLEIEWNIDSGVIKIIIDGSKTYCKNAIKPSTVGALVGDECL